MGASFLFYFIIIFFLRYFFSRKLYLKNFNNKNKEQMGGSFLIFFITSGARHFLGNVNSAELKGEKVAKMQF